MHFNCTHLVSMKWKLSQPVTQSQQGKETNSYLRAYNNWIYHNYSKSKSEMETNTSTITITHKHHFDVLTGNKSNKSEGKKKQTGKYLCKRVNVLVPYLAWLLLGATTTDTDTQTSMSKNWNGETNQKMGLQNLVPSVKKNRFYFKNIAPIIQF